MTASILCWFSLLSFLAAAPAQPLVAASGPDGDGHELLPLPEKCPNCSQPLPEPPVPPEDQEPPVVVVRVLAPAHVQDGKIVYQICVENRSHAPAFSVVVSDRLPANATYVSSEPPGKVEQGEVRWEFRGLDGGAKLCLQLVLAPTGPGEILNCVRVRYEHGVCVKTESTGSAAPAPGPTAPPKPGPEKPPPLELQSGRICLDVTAPARHLFNTPIPYKLTVTNAGSSPAADVVLTDQLPPGVELETGGASDGGRLLPEGRQVQWQLGTLAPNQARTVELKLRARPGEVLNRAQATSGALRASAEAKTEVVGAVGLHIAVTDSVDPVLVAEDTVYTIRVRNQGNAPAVNVRLTAKAPPGLAITAVQGPADHTHREGAPDVSFAPFSLSHEPGQNEAVFTVTAKAVKPGYHRFQVEMTADALPAGPVVEQEPTNVVTDITDASQVYRRSERLEWVQAQKMALPAK